MRVFFLLCIFLGACGREPVKKSSEVNQDVSGILSTEKIIVKVYFEEGAEPYTDQVATFELWNLLKVNLRALLEGRNMEVIVPTSLNQMTKLESNEKTNWTAEEVLSLSKTYTSQSDKNIFHIFFLKGLAADGSGIIGFHISNTKVIAVFKEVVKSTSSGPLDIVPKYVEQATLIHEMGHALGLVNNGIPMLTDHQDPAHGAHCTKKNCVMYHMNEGAAGLKGFVEKISSEGTIIMFDELCLEDARRYKK